MIVRGMGTQPGILFPCQTFRCRHPGFPLAKVPIRALNSIMSKGGLPTGANQTGTGVPGGTARIRTYKTAVGIGGLAGLVVGVLNLEAIAHGWMLGEYFDVLDSPVISLVEPAPVFNFRLWLSSPDFEHGVLGAILFYWAVIGLLLGWIFCLARAGVIRDIASEKICRWVLFAGVCVGALIGSLGFLAASNGWDYLGTLFESFNRPVNALVDILEARFQVLGSLLARPSTEFVCRHVAAIVYWMIIGLFLASLFCVVRILGKRMSARGTQARTE